QRGEPSGFPGRPGSLRREVSRRGFLRASAAGALASVSLPLLLEACGGAAAGPTSSSGSSAPAKSAGGAAGKQPLPAYIPFKNPLKPDFHSDDPRYDDGYNNFPANPFKAVAKSPGSGGTINVLIAAYYPAATARDQNPAWKEVEKQLNATVHMNAIPRVDYNAKLAAAMAGNDLPDIMHLPLGYASAPNLPDFFRAKGADLAPYLAGAAAKDYPNLAAIPTYAWKNSISAIDGKLYLIPIQRYLPLAASQGGYLFKNTDVWDKVIGAGTEPKDAADLKKMMQQLNRPGQSAYGATSRNRFGLSGFLQMFGAPNNWELDKSGKLVKDWETDQFKAAVSYVRDLWASGVIWADAPSNNDSRTNFVAKKFVLSMEGYGNGWNDFWRRGLKQKPAVHFAFMKPFAAQSGQKVTTFLSGGFIAMNVLKQAPPERIKELLRIIDWLAAPFGSQEDLLMSYGIKDIDYQLDAKGNPIPTKRGNSDAGYVPWRYICQHPQVSYQADIPGYAKASWDAEHEIIPNGVEDPTNGFYAPTQYGATSFTASQKVNDGLNAIILGRQPLSDLDHLVKDWQNAVGNRIRKEYM
ncbi:MAG: extracellular solute-binding protein, partial [Chloroflexota bacterium]|nr:extracellular solute-binding protein [Chloroflexota bacterium]